MQQPPFLKEGYLGLLTPDVREEFWNRMYRDCDGMTIGVRNQWLRFEHGREGCFIETDRELTKRALDTFIESIAIGKGDYLVLSKKFTMTHNPNYRPHVVTIRGESMIYVAPLCDQLIDALKLLAH